MAQGRKHEPTEEIRAKVRSLVAVGTPQEEVAAIVGISPPTLRKHYRDVLDVAHSEANAQVAGALFRLATTPGPQQVTAAIFWLKCQAGWRDRDPVGHIHASADSEAGATLLGLLKQADAYRPSDSDLEWLSSIRSGGDPSSN
jgi:hypothetical protein